MHYDEISKLFDHEINILIQAGNERGKSPRAKSSLMHDTGLSATDLTENLCPGYAQSTQSFGGSLPFHPLTNYVSLGVRSSKQWKHGKWVIPSRKPSFYRVLDAIESKNVKIMKLFD